MNHAKFALFIYSKHSKTSLKLKEIIDNHFDMESLCIDNNHVKQRLFENKIFIQRVPCILVFNSGVIDSFEGKQAFDWVNQFHQPPPPPPQYYMPPPPPPPQYYMPPPPPPPQYYAPPPQPVQRIYTPPPQPQTAVRTPIDQMVTESESESTPSPKKSQNAMEKKLDSIKSRAEELERERNNLFSKPGGPQNTQIGAKP